MCLNSGRQDTITPVSTSAGNGLINKREFLQGLVALLTVSATRSSIAGAVSNGDVGNFEYVYSNPELRQNFLEFLTNVFHLYPEQEFHDALVRLSKLGTSDREVYAALQQSLEEIQPFLGALRYAIPALSKQKAIMTEQTLKLLDPRRVIRDTWRSARREDTSVLWRMNLIFVAMSSCCIHTRQATALKISSNADSSARSENSSILTTTHRNLRTPFRRARSTWSPCISGFTTARSARERRSSRRSATLSGRVVR